MSYNLGGLASQDQASNPTNEDIFTITVIRVKDSKDYLVRLHGKTDLTVEEMINIGNILRDYGTKITGENTETDTKLY